MRLALAGLAAALLLAAAPVRAALVDPGAFTPAGPAITFGPAANIDQVNPSRLVGGVTVSFGGFFQGQSVDLNFPPVLTGTAPTAPLTLAGTATIREDRTVAGSIVLAGTSTQSDFYDPLAILFSSGVNAVAFRLGEFDGIGGVRIEAYGADGASLGTLTNSTTGFQSFRFAHGAGTPIHGVSISITGGIELAFGLDEVSFAGEPVVVVPAPGAAALMLLGVAGLLVARRR